MNDNSLNKMPLLSLKGISYDYVTKAETVHAVKDATYDFSEGKIYSITGRSGSGKSTLMSLIAGFDSPKTGEILHAGEKLVGRKMEEYRREHIGMVFQSYYLIPQLTVGENIKLSLEIAGKADKNSDKFICELLEIIKLPTAYMKKRINKLSGGEQQRVAIARAIAPNPSLILADEPTGNLDNENSQNILEILRSLVHDQGKGVIIITHASEIADGTDRVLVMNDGVLGER